MARPEWFIEFDTMNSAVVTYRCMTITVSMDEVDEFDESDQAFIQSIVNCLNKHYTAPEED